MLGIYNFQMVTTLVLFWLISGLKIYTDSKVHRLI